MLLDASVNEQSYVEDCEVCCNPIEIKASFSENELITFHIDKLGQ